MELKKNLVRNNNFVFYIIGFVPVIREIKMIQADMMVFHIVNCFIINEYLYSNQWHSALGHRPLFQLVPALQ